MPKRKRSVEDTDVEPVGYKRTRKGSRRNLLDVSDEVLIRILSHLPTNDLLNSEW